MMQQSQKADKGISKMEKEEKRLTAFFHFLKIATQRSLRGKWK